MKSLAVKLFLDADDYDIWPIFSEVESILGATKCATTTLDGHPEFASIQDLLASFSQDELDNLDDVVMETIPTTYVGWIYTDYETKANVMLRFLEPDRTSLSRDINNIIAVWLQALENKGFKVDIETEADFRFNLTVG